MRKDKHLLLRCILLIAVILTFETISWAQFVGFVRPLDWASYDGTVSIFYSTVYRGNYLGGPEGSGSHPGVDIPSDKFGNSLTTSTEIRSIYQGIIKRKTVYGKNDYGWGNSLVIEHTGIPDAGPTGVIFSTYAHLAGFAVNATKGREWNAGDTISRGALLGYAGRTGNSTGIHLHFQLDRDYTDYPLHPFWPNRTDGPSDAALEVATPDSDSLVLSHTLNPVLFVESHLAPSLRISTAACSQGNSCSGPQGTTFNFDGTSFTPDGTVRRFIEDSTGTQTELTPLLSADSSGQLSWSFTSSCSTPVGTFFVFAVDTTSGKTSNRVTEIITAGSCPSPVPAITVIPDSFDFGTVTLGSSSQTEFTIQNTGTGTLTVAGMDITPGDFILDFPAPPFDIVPGGSNTFRVIFVPSTVGSRQAAVTIDSNAPTSPTLVAVSGTGTNPPLAVATTSLPDAAEGTFYSTELQATGGAAPYTWSISSGNLPPGLVLDTASGSISGTAFSEGTYAFTVQVTDSSSPPQTATGALSITVFVSTPVSIATVWEGFWFPETKTCEPPPYPPQELKIELLQTGDQITGTLSGPGILTGVIRGTLVQGTIDATLDYGIQPPDGTLQGTIAGDSFTGFIQEEPREGFCTWTGPFELTLTSQFTVTGKAYVNNFGSNSVSVIDTGSDTAIGTIPVGPGPGPIRLTLDFAKAYVGNFNADSVSVIDTATDTVIQTLQVEAGPCNIAITPNGTKAYVTNFNANSVSVIDTTTDTVISRIQVETQPCAVAVSPTGAKVYVANLGSSSVSVIETATDTVTKTLIVGSAPFPVVFTPDGSKAYVVNRSSNTVSVIDVTTDTEIITIEVGVSPRDIGIKPDGSKAYVVNFGSLFTFSTVSVIDIASDTVTKTIGIGAFDAVDIALTPSGAKAYVAHTGSPFALGDISVIDTATDTVTTSFGVGNTPVFIALTPDGAKAYVANTNSESVSVIDTATDTVIKTLQVGNQPVDIAITP